MIDVNFSMSEINNILESAILPPVKGLNNLTALYYRKYLFQKLLSAFKWEMPELWDRDYFQYVLFGWGFICIFDSGVDGFGVIPQKCGLSGFNLFYKPREAIITNPLLPSVKQKIINEDCVVLESNLINSKLSYIFTVKNQNTANSVKKLYDQISQGNPAVVVDKDLRNEDGSSNWEVFQQNLSSNYIVSDLLQDMRRLENEFCCKVGIPTMNTEKRERMSEAEVTRNDVETESLIDGWMERLKDDIIKVNKMFPTVKLNVERRWNYESNNVNLRAV